MAQISEEAALNLHEYQSKRIFSQYGIPTPQGELAHSPEEALAAAKKLGGRVVKYIGDEVMALFLPGVSGAGYRRVAEREFKREKVTVLTYVAPGIP